MRRTPLSQINLVTGTSSGFGAMSARVLADAGHSVYTSKRDMAGRHDSSNDGCEVVNAVADRIRAEFFRRLPSHWP